jgi:uncharacterized oligopeptide transporter (OPT) family protein
MSTPTTPIRHFRSFSNSVIRSAKLAFPAGSVASEVIRAAKTQQNKAARIKIGVL